MDNIVHRAAPGFAGSAKYKIADYQARLWKKPDVSPGRSSWAAVFNGGSSVGGGLGGPARNEQVLGGTHVGGGKLLGVGNILGGISIGMQSLGGTPVTKQLLCGAPESRVHFHCGTTVGQLLFGSLLRGRQLIGGAPVGAVWLPWWTYLNEVHFIWRTHVYGIIFILGDTLSLTQLFRWTHVGWR